MTKWKLLAAFSTSALILIILAFAGYLSMPAVRARLSSRELNSRSVITAVKKLSQLVTVKYSIQRIVGLTEPKIPFGEESILLMVEGQALAGIDLAELKPEDVSANGVRSVKVMLPRPKIVQVSIDEKHTRVWDRHITWWTPWVPFDPDLEHKARLSALENVRSEALSMGILGDAQRNAIEVITGFLRSIGIDAQVAIRPT